MGFGGSPAGSGCQMVPMEVLLEGNEIAPFTPLSADSLPVDSDVPAKDQADWACQLIRVSDLTAMKS